MSFLAVPVELTVHPKMTKKSQSYHNILFHACSPVVTPMIAEVRGNSKFSSSLKQQHYKNVMCNNLTLPHQQLVALILQLVPVYNNNY